ncbi:cytidine/deoxycytidylate deaminase family protein [Candidatus Woesearchaeota archaeon]|nr:cytidine/deoxycytidylate deaminase family protein [Candidatus Woesearchaeota archaeon]
MAEKPQPHQRPDWDEYFFEIMDAVAKRGTCDRGRAGALIVKEKRILTTGYVGAPSGLPHCDEVGHLLRTVVYDDGEKHQHCVRTNHAEQNAIAQAAKYGISIDGATLYCKFEPCLDCAKLIINSGIRRVMCLRRYHGAKDTREMFRQAGIELVVMHDELEEYENQ